MFAYGPLARARCVRVQLCVWTVPPISKMMVEILTSQLSTKCCLNQYESKRSNVGRLRLEFGECLVLLVGVGLDLVCFNEDDMLMLCGREFTEREKVKK